MQIQIAIDNSPPSAGPSAASSSSSASNIIGGGKDQKYRFTVLTPGLIRLEYASDSTFEDRPSSFAVHRSSLPAPSFDFNETSTSLEITTSRFKLTYDKQNFTRGGLYATAGGSTWRWTDPNTGNLGGTIRTLDMMDGQYGMWNNQRTFVPLQDGVLGNSSPFTYLDDSSSMLFDPSTHFIASRLPGSDRIDGYLFVYGRDYREAMKAFYALSGSVPLLPRWALGNWWSRYYEYTDKTYLALMDKFHEYDIPLSVAVIDMDWHLVHEQEVIDAGASGWTGYTWNRKLFPDPPKFLTDLHSRDLKTTLNDHPADGIARYEDKYQEVAKFLNFDTSHGDAVPFDCTSKAYLTAYFDIVLKGLEDEGVDFWWIDWQQGTTSRLPNVDPLWVLNHYHYEHQLHRAGIKHPLIFSRYGGPGSHRYPIGFSGDTFTTWASLEFQPRFTATASNIGYGWWSHDIGGHQFGVRDDNLTIRWVQLGVLSPVMRLHSTKNRWVTKEPWNLPPTTTSIMAAWMQFRHRLIPYLYSMNVRASKELEPLVQPLYWSYPWSDQAYKYLNQYLFGSQLLVIPITSPQASGGSELGYVDGWLSSGKWVDFFTGAVYLGDRELSFSRPLEQYPVFLREGSIVALDSAQFPKNGAVNPAGFEVVVVVGADGKFDILEDPADVKTTSHRDFVDTRRAEGDLDCFPITYTQSTGKLVIGALQTTSSSAVASSAKRNWTIRLPALASSSSIEIGLEDVQDPILTYGKVASPSEDAKSGSIILCVGDVSVTQKITISLGADPKLRKNDPAALIEPIIKNAQILYSDKDKLWDAMTKEESLAFKVRRIENLDVDEALKRFALECLFADAE